MNSDATVNVLNIIGDDPLVEGGGVVYTEQGKKGPQFSWWGGPADPNIQPDTLYTVYTIPVPDNVIDTYSYIDITELAAFTHDTPEELQRLGESDDLSRRVSLLDLIQSFVGSSSMDQNPIVISFGAMVHKWGTEIAEPQDEDWEDDEDWEGEESDDEYETELWSEEEDDDED